MLASVMHDMIIRDPTMNPSAHASSVSAAGSVGFWTLSVFERFVVRVSRALCT